MRLAIHQPEFMPWLGFFNKMALADSYVVLDHVQFKKRYFENRNRIVSPKGEILYIGVPVKTKGLYRQSMGSVEIDNTQRWKDKLVRKIIYIYHKAPYFEKYFEDLCLTINKECNYLLELNMGIIDFFRKHLTIFTPMVYSSTLDIKSYRDSELILQLCLSEKADVYLSGVSGRNYLRTNEFENDGIRIEYLDYKSPVYGQLCKKFVSNMSALDLIFNCGEESLDIIMNNANGKNK